MLSVLDIFRIGIGPSSSHTVGPMRIAARFLRRLDRRGHLTEAHRIQIIYRGSLAFTGVGHGTPRAGMLGLLGFKPETIDLDAAKAALDRLHQTGQFQFRGQDLRFDPATDLITDYEQAAELHPNEMEMQAFRANGERLYKRTYYSTGGGFVATHAQLSRPVKDDMISVGDEAVPFNFGSASELLKFCDAQSASIADIILTNEDVRRPRAATEKKLDRVTDVMLAGIERGLSTQGILPGGLKVARRAPDIWAKLRGNPGANERETLFDWLNVYAMAVNEENAAGGQIVTAPTNGAAGIIPAVIRHYCCDENGQPNREKIRLFLITAGGIGLLYKQRASISGAEMGCQGEVGVACSMAAGGLAAVWGATPLQVASAAEIGMEHNLGLTCDPVGGLVQIPCIERNAIGAVKAANAARLALHGTGHGKVSLDQVIETMRQTGLDMSSKYKETSQGGLAVNVIEC
ncbi:L-serine ammonia-lyase [Litorimonas sp. WD9-15]|uniref:L-serine ammonia-lyase n=1 Tax=Litorimonas sp. WD9-15 TaxID=3418716 RepID=UPI003CFC2781